MSSVVEGTVLGGRYKLEQCRHAEGTTEHWDATDQTLKRKVLLILVQGDTVDATVDAARRFSDITDARLARVLDLGKFDVDGATGAYVVHDDLVGYSLADMVHEGPLTAEVARAVIGEITQALERAAKRGLHHQAITANHIVQTQAGDLRLMGTAVEAAAKGIEDEIPERAAREDVEALVRVLYTALTTQEPTEPLIPPQDLVASVSADLDTLCTVTLGGHDDGPRNPAELVAELLPWSRVPADILATGVLTGVTVNTDTIPVVVPATTEGAENAEGATDKQAAVEDGEVDGIVVVEPGVDDAGQGVDTDATDDEDVVVTAGKVEKASTDVSADVSTDKTATDQASTDKTPTDDRTGDGKTGESSAAPAGDADDVLEATAGATAPAAAAASKVAPSAQDTDAADADTAAADDEATSVTPVEDTNATKDGKASKNKGAAKQSPKKQTSTKGAAKKSSQKKGAAEQKQRDSLPIAGRAAAGAGAAAAAAGVQSPPTSAWDIFDSFAERTMTKRSTGKFVGGSIDDDSVPAGWKNGPAPQRRPEEYAPFEETVGTNQHAVSPLGARTSPTGIFVLTVLGIGALACLLIVLFALLFQGQSEPEVREAVRPDVTPTSVATDNAPPVEEPEELATIKIADGDSLDPEGGDGENDAEVKAMFDTDATTFWPTSTYATQDFAGLKSGVGAVLELPADAQISKLAVTEMGAGGKLEIRLADTKDHEAGTEIASFSPDGTEHEFEFEEPVSGEYLILWYTQLPESPEGAWRGQISNVEVLGTE